MESFKLGAMIFQKSRLVAMATIVACALPVFAQSKTTPSSSKPKAPSQAQLARKGAFPIVKASDPSVKTALPATDLAKARTKLNQMASISGVVTSLYAPKNGKRVLVDFAPDYKKAVIGLVDAKNFKTFPDLRQLKGKRVLLSGKVVAFKEQTQVELVSASAIRLIK